jgi:hypothetical protein
MGFHIAQVNVALPREPLDSPLLAEFVAALEPVNALADHSPGFVWRLQDDGGDATSFRLLDDDRLLVNLSVWDSIEALARFVYQGDHAAVMRRRREWFVHVTEVITALWWVPAGHIPSLEEAEERLTHLREFGPKPFAFTFRDRFPLPDAGAAQALRDAEWHCPA